jgi:hypothetical protein
MNISERLAKTADRYYIGCDPAHQRRSAMTVTIYDSNMHVVHVGTVSERLADPTALRREERWVAAYLRREAARRNVWWRRALRWLRG